VASSKRDRAGSSRVGVAHHGERPIFGSMLGLGRTAGGTGGAEFGCRLSPANRVHGHPEPLIPSKATFGRFRVVVRIVDVDMSSEIALPATLEPAGMVY
jgi:hypothetical protein